MKKLKMFLAGLLAVSLLVACSDDEKKEPKPVTPPEPVEAVTFTPAGGEVESGATVTLATATEGASIYYVFGGKAVDLTESYATDGTLYTAPVAITEAGVLSAVAVKDKTVSTLTTADYTILVPSITMDITTAVEGVKVEKKVTDTGYSVLVTYDPSKVTGDQVFAVSFADGAEGVKFVDGENEVLVTEATTVFVPAESAYNVAITLGAENLAFTFKKDGYKDAVVTFAFDTPPVNDIKDGLVDNVKSYWVSDAAGIKKLAELVNGGNTLAGYKFVVQNDIKLNTKKVVQNGFVEPEEGAGATANAKYENYDSIGTKDAAFAGTFDGNGKVIDGFYAYQAHQGLGFIGNAAAATIKNVILTNACVINCNASADADGADDDRFGGLVGLITADGTVIENCVFTGVVGSDAAKARGGAYEYIGGLVGRADKKATATNCIVFARFYGDGDVVNKKGAENITQTDVVGIDAATYTEGAYTGDNAYVLAAIELLNKQPLVVAPVTFDPAEAEGAKEVELNTPVTMATTTEGAVIYFEFVAGSAEATINAENCATFTEYTVPVPVPAAGTFYAYAVVAAEDAVSEVASSKYIIQGDTEAPTFDPAAGMVESGTPVTLATVTPGAEIYYEIVEGDAAVTITAENLKEKTPYTAAIEITKPVKIVAYAVKGTKVSLVAEASYSIPVPPKGVPYAETAPGVVVAETTKLRFYADLVADNDHGANVYYQFVTGEGTSTLTTENYKDETVATKYTDSIKISESGTFYCIAEHDGKVTDIVSFAYVAKTALELGTEAVNEKVAAMAAASVTPTATNDIKDGLADGVTEYIVTDVAGLQKLSEIVSGGNTLARYTITVANDITVNAKVLKDGFLEPDEGENCTPNADLVNLDSIGMRKKPFCGTFDGNGKVISGLYIYQGHQGLAFIGEAGDGAVIKNVILRDACVINNNKSCGDDGSDDDRFGLLVGSSEYSSGSITIENCVVEGVVGSQAAVDRKNIAGPNGDVGKGYEYGAGIMGEVGKSSSTIVVTIKNCTVLVRNYTSSDKTIVNKERVTPVQENNVGYAVK